MTVVYHIIATAFGLLSIGAWVFFAFDMLRMVSLRVVAPERIKDEKWRFIRRFLIVLAVFGICGFVASLFSELARQPPH